MGHPFEAFVTRHRLDATARAELERMMAEVSSVDVGPRALLDPISVAPAQTAATAVTAATADNVDQSATLDPPRSSSSGGVALSTRYVDQGPLGAGGMGEVRRVYDRFLRRTVALKTLHWKLIDASRARARFDAESSMTAGLEHPGIVPVYDRGTAAGGAPWFTMKFVRGRTLAEVADAGESPRALVEAFARVCDAMAYAHARGVMHRDLKPSNVMVGEFGEVLVMDWGLARRVDGTDDAIDPSAPTDDAHEPRPELTGAGDALGTPAYMPPEQIDRRFGEMGAYSDVYALGATLYRLVAGHHAHAGGAHSILRAVIGRRPPVLDGAPEGVRPIIARAMAYDPEARYADAGEMAVDVRRWLDGQARRAKARGMILRAMRLRPEAARLRTEAERLEDEASAILGPLPPFAPIDQKAPGWTLEDRAAETRRQARLADVAYLQALRAALEVDPALPEGRSALDRYYRDRLLDAEARRDADSAAEYAALLRSHDAEGNAEWLRGDGSVTLVTDPPGAAVELYRYVEQKRRLVPVFERSMPSTPFFDVPLAMGSWLMRITAPGRAPVDYPVFIERAGRWDGIRPGADSPHAIWLPPEGELAEDDCYVPAGWFISGGDPEAPDGLPRQRVWLDGFVIKKHPVANGQYGAFLDALLAAGRPDDSARLCPTDTHAGSDAGARTLAFTVENGRHVLARTQSMSRQPDWAVVGISHGMALEYTEWAGVRGGLAWRLPGELEWEKAARGVDGRSFVWGEHFDPTWALVMHHRSGRPMMEAVGSVGTDSSPYGVVGLTGHVRDLCMDRYERRGPTIDHGLWRPTSIEVGPDDFIVIRGGSFISQPSLCRTAARFGLRPHQSVTSSGFRLCRSTPS